MKVTLIPPVAKRVVLEGDLGAAHINYLSLSIQEARDLRDKLTIALDQV